MENPLHPTTPEKPSVRLSEPRLGVLPSKSPSDTAQAVRQRATSSGHNVFRPDIYRVSEGYMN